MDKQRILASIVVFLILAVLVYLQYRHWRTFDWGTFWSQIHRIRKIHVVHAIALVYAAYVLRALRWKMFLMPVRPKVKVIELVPPMMIGFTGLALLGLGAARASAEEHPRMHVALFELRQARTELKEAKHDFGGHRVKAVKHIDQAIAELQLALKFDKK